MTLSVFTHKVCAILLLVIYDIMNILYLFMKIIFLSFSDRKAKKEERKNTNNLIFHHTIYNIPVSYIKLQKN